MIKEYALLMLDNMPLQKHFVIGKIIGYIETDDIDQKDFAIYQDLITENIIYPSSYEANEFIDSNEYVKHLKELKWVSRKFISKEEALKKLKKLSKDDILSYGINVGTSKQKKLDSYEEKLQQHNKTLKKINRKKENRRLKNLF